MDDRKQELSNELERYYRSCGWSVERAVDGTIRAVGTGGVTWIGIAVVADDLSSDEFPARLLELSDVRMGDDGARCPFELLPDAECADELHSLVHRLQLTERVSVYSLAA
ncbi:MAG: hypothetical protein ABR583_03225 [Gaiellaceae bacterium]